MTQQGMIFFNAMGSINAHLLTFLSMVEFYSWAGTRPSVVFWFPDVPLDPPCFAIAHLPSQFSLEGHLENYPGKRTTHATGIVEVSCVVLKSLPNWVALQTLMADMVLGSISVSTIPIYDYGRNPSSPGSTPVGVVEFVQGRIVPLYTEDPNPNVSRSRVLVDYRFRHQSG